MPTFLVTERKGRRSETLDETQMVIEAEDEQMVKYYWHKRQNEMGGSQRQFIGKHTYEHHSRGYWVELVTIEELSQTEADVMEERLPRLPK